MKLKTKNILTSNAPLKALSLVFGYTFWHIFGTLSTKSIWVTVPLCFYSASTQHAIEAPDAIKIHLTGKRTNIYAIDRSTLAAHINADKLFPGKHSISITADSLFLPDTIKLVHYIPSNLHITIKKI